MNPTHRLLLHLCHLQVPLADRAFNQGGQEPIIDWDLLLQLADKGGVAGLVSRHLDGLDLPQSTRLAFAVLALRTQRRNLVLMSEGHKLCACAESEGLELVPIKGAALNLGLPYDDLGMRAMCDLDLLARPAQFPALERLMLGRGYREVGGRQSSLRYSHRLAYQKVIGSVEVLVELHWSPFFVMYGTPPMDAAALRRARFHRHGNHRFRVLAPDDMMLSLLLHLAGHRFRAQLKWVVDIAELSLLLQGQLDWEAIWANAKILSGQRAALFAAELARELLRAPIPKAAHPKTLGLLNLLSPPMDAVTSESQPAWSRRLMINWMQYDSPRPALRFLFHKATELIERFGGIKTPRLLARRDPLGPA